MHKVTVVIINEITILFNVLILLLVTIATYCYASIMHIYCICPLVTIIITSYVHYIFAPYGYHTIITNMYGYSNGHHSKSAGNCSTYHDDHYMFNMDNIAAFIVHNHHQLLLFIIVHNMVTHVL